MVRQHCNFYCLIHILACNIGWYWTRIGITRFLSEAGVAGVCESRSVLNVPVRHQVESHLKKGSHDKSDS